jgi:hypothetical protein
MHYGQVIECLGAPPILLEALDAFEFWKHAPGKFYLHGFKCCTYFKAAGRAYLATSTVQASKYMRPMFVLSIRLANGEDELVTFEGDSPTAPGEKLKEHLGIKTTYVLMFSFLCFFVQFLFSLSIYINKKGRKK